MLIAFVHTGKAFLPEIEAYVNFFSSKGIATRVVTQGDLEFLKPEVIWNFLGIDRSQPKYGLVIHEYASASVPPFSHLKNIAKKWINTKPSYRLFLNDYVHSSFAFNDSIPFGFRNMGVTLGLQSAKALKKYDFIYVGDVSTQRGVLQLLNKFTKGTLLNKNILILSKNFSALQKKYIDYPNIIFTGPVHYNDVPLYLSKARYGINFVRNAEPFNRQTSTKLLEYAAAKIPIITTDYTWVREFEKKYGGSFFYLNNDFSNFNWDNISRFQYAFPDLSEWTWENQIKKSGVLEFLAAKFPELKW